MNKKGFFTHKMKKYRTQQSLEQVRASATESVHALKHFSLQYISRSGLFFILNKTKV